jgi:tetratricopeptide (TPR) repeat protein
MHSLRPDLPAGDFLTGLVDEAEGKLDAARASFERAIRLAPGYPEPLAAAVRIDLKQNQEQRALARVEQAVAGRPTSGSLLALKAEVLAQLRRFDESADAASQAIARAPSWWVPYEDLARAEAGRGRPQAAVAAYQRGLEATQSAPPLVLHLSALFEQLGRLGEAMALYESWLKREPGSAIASNNLAMLLLTHRRTDPASLDRALELARPLEKSTQPEFLDTLGWVHYLRGEYAPAIDVLQRAVAAAPDAPVFRAHLGLAQFHAAQRDAARDNLRRALSSSASFPELAEARAALAQLRSGP